MSDEENRYYNPELDPNHPANRSSLPERLVAWIVLAELVIPLVVGIVLWLSGAHIAAMIVAVAGLVTILLTISVASG
ncbi:MAG: hypothetical protein MRY72_00850 [Aquisalinus sp.]|nr:hypothetical protein [Aquisalinus sp.]